MGSSLRIDEFGDPEADLVLIQPVDARDLEMIRQETVLISASCDRRFCLKAIRIGDWNRDLSPWEAPAVFGRESFGGGAMRTLEEILKQCEESSRTFYIGGYSLAGLFSLWAAYQTGRFSGVAAASPSMWFPGFDRFLRENRIRAGQVYLSLGYREEKTRNPVMATVGDRIREAHSFLKEQGVDCTLEWNEGNHFKDPHIRTAKAFAWLMNHDRGDEEPE